MASSDDDGDVDDDLDADDESYQAGCVAPWLFRISACSCKRRSEFRSDTLRWYACDVDAFVEAWAHCDVMFLEL